MMASLSVTVADDERRSLPDRRNAGRWDCRNMRMVGCQAVRITASRPRWLMGRGTAAMRINEARWLADTHSTGLLGKHSKNFMECDAHWKSIP